MFLERLNGPFLERRINNLEVPLLRQPGDHVYMPWLIAFYLPPPPFQPPALYTPGFRPSPPQVLYNII